MTEPLKKPRKPPTGRPFVKGDPRTKNGGRPKKTVTWKQAEDALRAALPRILLMTTQARADLLNQNPTGAEALAVVYVEEHPIEAVNRFLGKTPEVVKAEMTGADGAPLLPPPLDLSQLSEAQLDRFVAAAARASKPAALPSVPAP